MQYDWCVTGTDTDGTTTTSATETFTTDFTKPTPTSYPTGNVNPFNAQKFTWTFTWDHAGGNSTQNGARLY